MSTKTQRLVLDLEKNTDLADLVADTEPGDKLDAVLSIVHKDDKSLTVELEEVLNSDGDSTAEEDDEEEEVESDSKDRKEDSSGYSPATRMMKGE